MKKLLQIILVSIWLSAQAWAADAPAPSTAELELQKQLYEARMQILIQQGQINAMLSSDFQMLGIQAKAIGDQLQKAKEAKPEEKKP